MLTGYSLKNQFNINKLVTKSPSSENESLNFADEYEKPILDSYLMILQNKEESGMVAKSCDVRSARFFGSITHKNRQNSSLSRIQESKCIIPVNGRCKKLLGIDPRIDEHEIYKRPNLLQSVSNVLNNIGEKQILK